MVNGCTCEQSNNISLSRLCKTGLCVIQVLFLIFHIISCQLCFGIDSDINIDYINDPSRFDIHHAFGYSTNIFCQQFNQSTLTHTSSNIFSYDISCDNNTIGLSINSEQDTNQDHNSIEFINNKTASDLNIKKNNDLKSVNTHFSTDKSLKYTFNVHASFTKVFQIYLGVIYGYQQHQLHNLSVQDNFVSSVKGISLELSYPITSYNINITPRCRHIIEYYTTRNVFLSQNGINSSNKENIRNKRKNTRKQNIIGHILSNFLDIGNTEKQYNNSKQFSKLDELLQTTEFGVKLSTKFIKNDIKFRPFINIDVIVKNISCDRNQYNIQSSKNIGADIVYSETDNVTDISTNASKSTTSSSTATDIYQSYIDQRQRILPIATYLSLGTEISNNFLNVKIAYKTGLQHKYKELICAINLLF